MTRPNLILAVLIGCAQPAFADDTMILRAGEWSVVRDGQHGQAMKICYGADHPLGQLAGAGMESCVQETQVSPDKVLTIKAICQIADTRVLVNGTIRPTGTDAFRADSRIRFDGAEPKSVSLGITAMRMGPCQPGDTPG
jgi:hypothetical protein